MEMNEKYREVFSSLSKELNLRLGYDTHYDAQNCVYSRVNGLKKIRIDFQPMDNARYVVTKNIDTYKFAPGLIDFLYRFVPMFPAPLFVKVSHTSLGQVSGNQSPGEFKNNVKQILEQAI